MDRIKNLLIIILEKLNSTYELYSKQELKKVIDGIKTSNEEEISKKVTNLLDFTIKHHCFNEYRGEFDELKRVISKSLNKSCNEHCIKLIISYMKDHNLDYYVCGTVALDIGLASMIQSEHKDMDILINEDDLDELLDTLYGLGFDIDDLRLNQKYGHLADGKIVDAPSHEIVASRTDNFGVGLVLFNRDSAGNMIQKKYLYVHEPIEVVREVPILLEKKKYHKDPKTGIRIESLENIYVNKNNRYLPSDLNDLLLIAEKIDYDAVNTIRNSPCPWHEKEIRKDDKYGL